MLFVCLQPLKIYYPVCLQPLKIYYPVANLSEKEEILVIRISFFAIIYSIRTFSLPIMTFNDPLYEAFGNILGKGENAGEGIFNPSQIKFQFFSHIIYFVVCICFQFGPVQNFVVW